MTKRTIKTMPGLLMILLLPAIGGAQEHHDFRNMTPEERAQQQTDWMKKDLSLDSTVVPKVYDINLKYAKLNHTVMQSDEPREDKFSKFRANNDKRDQELKKVLTADQYTLYQQKQEERRQQMRQHWNNNH